MTAPLAAPPLAEPGLSGLCPTSGGVAGRSNPAYPVYPVKKSRLVSGASSHLSADVLSAEPRGRKNCGQYKEPLRTEFSLRGVKLLSVAWQITQLDVPPLLLFSAGRGEVLFFSIFSFIFASFGFICKAFCQYSIASLVIPLALYTSPMWS